MPAQINVSITIDVVGALRAGTLSGYVAMRDNSRTPYTTGQGTSWLSTACPHGTVINWFLYPVDVQSPVALSNVAFLGPLNPCAKLRVYGIPLNPNDNKIVGTSWPYWAGIVERGIPAGVYHYGLEFRIGNRTMFLTELPSLGVLPGETNQRTRSGRTLRQNQMLFE